MGTDISAMRLLNHSVREVAGTPIISLNESPLTSSRVSMALKAIMDRSIAAIALLCLSPLLIGVAVAVKRSSRGQYSLNKTAQALMARYLKSGNSAA